MGIADSARVFAEQLLRATGSLPPVQAHRFALDLGFQLRPTTRSPAKICGDTLEYNATIAFDEQESALLECLARWLLERVGERATPEHVTEVLDVWLTYREVADAVWGPSFRA